MGILNKIAQYREFKSGVKHCTFNPDGPGVVRIHLIPPKFKLLKSASYIVILNGYYLLPLGYSWAIMLSAFMKETNEYSGREISEADYEKIIEKTDERKSKSSSHKYPGNAVGSIPSAPEKSRNQYGTDKQYTAHTGSARFSFIQQFWGQQIFVSVSRADVEISEHGCESFTEDRNDQKSHCGGSARTESDVFKKTQRTER